MSALLDDIINLAIDGKQPLPDTLRKCLLLGHELKNEQLKGWANQELNGYASRDVPEYRIVQGPAYGDFIGPFYQQWQKHIIPPAVLEQQHREWAETLYLTAAISSYSELITGSSGVLRFPWPANMVGYYQDKIMQGGFICHAAWQAIPTTALVGVLDTIRNRTLNMALAIKDELGTSYDDLRRIASSETKNKIQSIIIQNTGGNTNVAFGATVDASGQGQTIIAVGDRKTLDAALRQAGLESGDLDSLTVAVQNDGAKPGNKVGEWVKEKGSKVLSGGVRVGTKIGSEILTAWIKQHYGL